MLFFGSWTITRTKVWTDERSKLTSPSAPLLHKLKHWQNVVYMNVTQHQQHPPLIRPRLHVRLARKQQRQDTAVSSQWPCAATSTLSHRTRFFFFFFTKTPLDIITSSKQHKIHQHKTAPQSDGGQVKGHVTVDNTMRPQQADEKRSERWPADVDVIGKQEIHLHLIQHKCLYVDSVVGFKHTLHLHSLTYLCHFLYVGSSVFTKGFGIQFLKHLHFTHLSSCRFLTSGMQHKNRFTPYVADTDARLNLGTQLLYMLYCSYLQLSKCSKSVLPVRHHICLLTSYLLLLSLL